MKNVGILLKNYIQNFFGSFFNKNKKKSTIAVVIIMIIAFIYFFSSLFLSSKLQIEEVLSKGEAHQVLVIFANSLLLIFIFPMLLAFSQGIKPREYRDRDMLLSMPFRHREIIASRVLYDSILNIIFVMFIAVAQFIPYLIWASNYFKFIHLLKLLYLVLLLSLLASSLSVILSTILEGLTSRLKNPKLIQTILLMVGMGVYLLVFTFNQNLTNSIFESGVMINSFLDNHFINRLMYHIAYEGNLLVILIATLSVILLMFISINLLKRVYFKEHHKKDVTSKEDQTEGIFNILLKREIKDYWSSPNYVLNTIMGNIFQVLLAIIILVKGNIYETIGLDYDLVLIASIVLVNLISGMTNTTCFSISLEGKRFWLLKSLPIEAKDVFKAKIIHNMLVMAPFGLIANILLSIKYGIIYLPIGLVICLLSIIFAAYQGLIINLLVPKIDFIDETQVIKQSKSSLFSIALGFLYLIINFGLFLFLSLFINLTIAVIVVIVLIVFIDFILILTIKNKGSKLFNKIY